MIVNELISQSLFSDLIPLTEDFTLNRQVSTIDITETPDVAKFTAPHSLILTTAMVFKDNQSELIPFIDSLVSADVAGLCIKTSRFLNTIEESVISYANSVHFPIIEIPVNTTLGVLSHKMFDYILGKQTQNMLYALDIQKHYSNLVIAGASPQAILDELSSTIHAPIILFNPFMRQVGHSSVVSMSNNPLEFYVNQIKSQINNCDGRVQSFQIQMDMNNSTNVNVYPIKANSSFPYYLAILKPNSLSYPIAQFAIDQSIMVLSYIIYKNDQLENSMIRLQNSFFTKLLFGSHPTNRNDSSFFEQSLNYGLINSTYYQVILCKHVNENTLHNQDSELSISVYQWLVETTVPTLKYSVSFYNSNSNTTRILLQHPVDNLDQKLTESANELHKLLGIKVRFGIGLVVDHPYEISNSYFEATKSLETDSNKIVNHYNPLGLMSLFNENSHEAILYFIKHQLKNLAFSNDPLDLDLLTTLKVYLDNQSEISKTADLLFVHRNTINYRIKKCEDLLNIDLKDPQTSLNIRIALALHDTKSSHI